MPSPTHKRAKSVSSTTVNWTRCILCQDKNVTNTSGPLVCPALNPNPSTRTAGYKTISSNLLAFSKLGALPLSIDLDKLDDGSGLEATLSKNNAKWHRTCYMKYNNDKLKRAEKRSIHGSPKDCIAPATPSPLRQIQNRVTTRSVPSPISSRPSVPTCLLCGGQASRTLSLHKITEKERDEELQRLCKTTTDENVKGILEAQLAGDFRSQDLKYHDACLRNLRNSVRTGPAVNAEAAGRRMCEAMAFADLQAHIADTLRRLDTRYHRFNMTSLSKMYSERLAQLEGVDIEELPEVHSTRLRERILDHFPRLIEDKVGRSYHLVSPEAVKHILKQGDLDDDAVALQRVIRILRSEMLQHTALFDGTFPEGCQEKSVPPILLGVISSLLYGQSATNVSRATQTALTACQTLMFGLQNTMPTSDTPRHKQIREPPLVVYLGLTAYGKWNSKSTVNDMFDLGISVSHTRLREITAGLGTLVVERALEEGLLCPAPLRKGIFTASAYDNLDINPTSNTAGESFHGTSISIFQAPTMYIPGEKRSFVAKIDDIMMCSGKKKRQVPNLPEKFAVVKAVVLANKAPKPAISGRLPLTYSEISQDLWKQEKSWLSYIRNLSESDVTGKLDLSWAAFHATLWASQTIVPSISTFLPVFYESSTSIGMLCHGIDLTLEITKHLNEGQVSVMTVDQPLYALSKMAQWSWPEKYGPDKICFFFASFHIETGFFRVLGDILYESGWVGVMASSGIMSETKANASLKVSHLKRARRSHEVTMAALDSLLHDAYKEDSESEYFDDWVQSRSQKYPVFLYWLMILNLEALAFSFVKSIRTKNYELYLECLQKMIPCFSVVDRHHYARWLSVQLHDLINLSHVAPSLQYEFMNGNFAFYRTSAPFSALAIDQCHEQNNAIIKNDTGPAGILSDPDKLKRWMIAGPEVAKLLKDFIGRPDKPQTLHHEQYRAFQTKFMTDVAKLKESFVQIGNPFLENSEHLLAIDSAVVMSHQSLENLRKLPDVGVSLAAEFFRDRLSVHGKCLSLFDPIRKANLRVFGKAQAMQRAETQLLKDVKCDLNLFARMLVASQSRNVNFEEFFSHENLPFPPALSKNGEMHKGSKSDIIQILMQYVGAEKMGKCGGAIYDGAAMAHLVKPTLSKTYKEYWQISFQPVLLRDVQSTGATRVDLVFDNYHALSLKQDTRTQRGAGVRRRVTATAPIPRNWQDFLRNNVNKSELFRFLAYSLLSDGTMTCSVTNVGDTIIASAETSTTLAGISCVEQEEADGRIILHASDMVTAGITTIKIRTVDSDVLVLAVSFFWKLREGGLQELWVDLGTGIHRKQIPAHTIATALGERQATALRGFAAFTGCDQVSQFVGKGKLSCFSKWRSLPEATDAFWDISFPLLSVPDSTILLLEKFVVHLFNGDISLPVDENRKQLVTKHGKLPQKIPPRSDALSLHILRSAYQGGHIWGQAGCATPSMPSPSEWGWVQRDGAWQPRWTTKPSIWEGCRDLIKCGCKLGDCSTNQCACWAAGVPCMLLCTHCHGETCKNTNDLTVQSEEVTRLPEKDAEEDVDDPEEAGEDTSDEEQ